jgi:hypothetical protein
MRIRRNIQTVKDSREEPAYRGEAAREPWQSWGTTVRYLVICLGLAVLAVLLVWAASGFHLIGAVSGLAIWRSLKLRW